MAGDLKGLIFDIQGHSVHDGPGCRTLVFLSGCPLRCAWCANPEGQLPRPRLMYREMKCIYSHYHCIQACSKEAISKHDQGSSHLDFNRSLCDRCTSMECASSCLNEALKIAGRYYEVDDLMQILARDQDYWGSQGGITFSGGEPLLQDEFLLGVLHRCRSSYMHIAVETSAYVNTDLLREVLNWIDWLFIDIKHMNPQAHQDKTGVNNALILKNVEMVATSGWDGRCVIRETIILGYNDAEDNLLVMAEFMQRLGLKELNLLPFHRLGNSKYEQLGLYYEYSRVESPSRESLLTYQSLFKNTGLHCYVDFETPF
jgi:pyruvate formate lyase activating enzyme